METFEKEWQDRQLMSFEGLSLRFDSLLEREAELGHSHIRVVGTSSLTAIALQLTHTSAKKIGVNPSLVIVPTQNEANKLQQALEFFDAGRKSFVLPHFDVSPFSGLEPAPQIVRERLNFLFHASHAKPGDIFIAPITSLQQLTVPFKELADNCFHLKKGDDLPQDFFGWLSRMGYVASPLVEDAGQYSSRGGIIDIFSPAQSFPIRIELFGDTVESLRSFSPVDQKSIGEISDADIIPAKESFYLEDNQDHLLECFRASLAGREVEPSESEETLRAIARFNFFQGQDFLLPFFFKKLESPISHFHSNLSVWLLDSSELKRKADHLIEELNQDRSTNAKNLTYPEVSQFYQSFSDINDFRESFTLEFTGVDIDDFEDSPDVSKVSYPSFSVADFSSFLSGKTIGSDSWFDALGQKLNGWKEQHYRILISVRHQSQAERIRLLVEKIDWKVRIPDAAQESWFQWLSEQDNQEKLATIVTRILPESLRIPEERLIFLKDEDLLGKKQRVIETRAAEDFQSQAKRLSFGDLKPGDFVVHIQHGIGVYDGLKIMSIGGADSEFIQISYKDKDRLYLPVYRVSQLQKYAGAQQAIVPDKLGGQQWEKTKAKVRAHLRDIASSLLELYAKRAELVRPAFDIHEKDFTAFEAAFPFDETEDQLKAIRDFYKDMTSTKPMDRLICGDVGFGKTEVAMRAAFIAAHSGKQVAILAPTTVLSFQHLETFKKRFAGWPIEIRALNRFVSSQEVKKTISALSEGKVDILIGTHRILSKDVVFKDLGLLIVDEEQKFGVAHKERIKKLRNSVDTIAMSATPIPRTLNMSLVGVRDLSLINTAPVDRLPTRTFVSKWDPENIRKAIEAEISRGGQIYFIHNRIQSIYGLADEIRQIVPHARLRVAHGQMDEGELEQTMVQFFNHEIDVLVCTAIVESGMDVSRANTMFIDQAQQMGLSQLYQLRGRVGRSKQRAYCYLLLPRGKKLDKTAQERLKVLQENSALGSGIRIAQYDLELRGAGNILGEEQSGHVDSVGYELYMDLLNESIHQLRGEPFDNVEVDPEINLRIPALIPDKYISDIRIRLSYYKALADINNHEDLERIESELKDQFGEIPEPTLNLMGLMLIRSQCKKLGVRDISAGPKNISLIFTEKTKLKPETAIQLAMRENKKYSITPDNRLNVRMNNITWPGVYDELEYLLKL